jgi:hypothetical protein
MKIMSSEVATSGEPAKLLKVALRGRLWLINRVSRWLVESFTNARACYLRGIDRQFAKSRPRRRVAR